MNSTMTGCIFNRTFLYCIISFILTAILFTSCAHSKKITYFQDLADTTKIYSQAMTGTYEPKIQPDDVLGISVNSINPQATAIFNMQGSNAAQLAPPANMGTAVNTRSNENNAALNGYLVNKKGIIEFPVLGSLNVGGLTTAQLWLRSGWKPDFIFNYERFRYHFDFGYKLTFAGIIDTIYQNAYTLIIGKFFSASQLGYYTRAATLRQLPVQTISSALNKVTYPVFSSLQEDDVKLKSAYKKLMQQVLFWIAPTLVILVVIAEPLFRFLLTEKWLPAVPYFQILCVAGIMYPLQAYNLNILKVKGRSDLYMRLSIIRKIFFTIGVFCAVPFGIYGLLCFQVISTFIGFVSNTWYSGRLINYPMKEQLRDVVPIILLASFVGVLVWLIGIYVKHSFFMPDFLQLILFSCMYFIIYLIISYYTNMTSLSDFRQIVFKNGLIKQSFLK